MRLVSLEIEQRPKSLSGESASTCDDTEGLNSACLRQSIAALQDSSEMSGKVLDVQDIVKMLEQEPHDIAVSLDMLHPRNYLPVDTL